MNGKRGKWLDRRLKGWFWQVVEAFSYTLALILCGWLVMLAMQG
jgi:hypothetical protein